MRYICKTIQELKYLDKKLNLTLPLYVYSDFVSHAHIDLDNGRYTICYDKCEGCQYLGNFCEIKTIPIAVSVQKLLRNQKLKRILE